MITAPQTTKDGEDTLEFDECINRIIQELAKHKLNVTTKERRKLARSLAYIGMNWTLGQLSKAELK